MGNSFLGSEGGMNPMKPNEIEFENHDILYARNFMGRQWMLSIPTQPVSCSHRFPGHS